MKSETLTWILGQGGLLGSHLAEAIQTYPQFLLWQPSPTPFPWKDREKLSQRLKEEISALGEVMSTKRIEQWTILWAAGIGRIGDTNDMLQAETQTYQELLHLLKTLLLPSHPKGTIFFASSAGALYGNLKSEATEETPPSPISEYGRQKLEQEKILKEWSKDFPSVSFIIGRISNLYGIQKNVHKHQGLISHLSRSLILQKPLHIFVSLDTTRDYLYAENCARSIVRYLSEWLNTTPRTKESLKLFVSERPTTIAEILHTFTQVTKRPPRFISAPRYQSREHPLSVRFRSTVPPNHFPLPLTPLPVGIHRIYSHHLTLFAQGKLS